MQIKTFSARTTAAVLSKIKEELGPDAVILDTAEENGLVTMTAALERPSSPYLQAPFAPPFAAPGRGAAGGLGAASGGAAYPRAGSGGRSSFDMEMSRAASHDAGHDAGREPGRGYGGNSGFDGAEGAGFPEAMLSQVEDTYTPQKKRSRGGRGLAEDVGGGINGSSGATPGHTSRGGATRGGATRTAAGAARGMAHEAAFAPGADPAFASATGSASGSATGSATGPDANAGSQARYEANAGLERGHGAGHSNGPNSGQSSGQNGGQRYGAQYEQGAAQGSGQAFARASGYASGYASGRSAGPILSRLDARKIAEAEAMAGSVPPGWQQWHEEWNSIKTHLFALMKPAMRLDSLPPRQRLAIEFLQREGVDDAAVLALFQRLQADPAGSILEPLSQMVPVHAWSPENWPQRLHFIAGPFGAGKTSVAIRKALVLRKLSPQRSICLVNADATRGNGRLLLRHYCDLSDFACKEAATTLELVGAVNEALRENFDIVIIDLPGLSRGRHLATLFADGGFASLVSGGEEDIAVHVALPPLFDAAQMKAMTERYHTGYAGSLVWTKLDEAEHYGQIVNVGTMTGLPVSSVSFGPGLGNSLSPAKDTLLWRLLFKRELPSGAP